ncbi:MAG: hypothetical protein IH607_00455 [Firmicutes bacterium]|nr:hypothetical protein [Bacillota bacterium]
MPPIPKKLMFPHTITLYNHYRTFAREDAWKRTVLQDVQYTESNIKSVSANGIIQIADSVTVFIAMQNGYVSPDVFAVASDQSGIWTLNTKNNQDAVVYGVCIQEITGNYLLDDLFTEHRAKILKSCVDYTNAPIRHLRHWEVTCT